MNDIVWITKYALEGVIFSRVVNLVNGIAIAKDGVNIYRPGEWRDNLSDAISRAEDMRDAKIKSLKKQLAALEKLEFDAAEILNKDGS